MPMPDIKISHEEAVLLVGAVSYHFNDCDGVVYPPERRRMAQALVERLEANLRHNYECAVEAAMDAHGETEPDDAE